MSGAEWSPGVWGLGRDWPFYGSFLIAEQMELKALWVGFCDRQPHRMATGAVPKHVQWKHGGSVVSAHFRIKETPALISRYNFLKGREPRDGGSGKRRERSFFFF